MQTVSDGKGNTFLEVDIRFPLMSEKLSHAFGLPKPTCFPKYAVGEAQKKLRGIRAMRDRDNPSLSLILQMWRARHNRGLRLHLC